MDSKEIITTLVDAAQDALTAIEELDEDRRVQDQGDYEPDLIMKKVAAKLRVAIAQAG